MFYQNLGGTLGQPILDSGDPDLALFPTLQSTIYWSGTEYNSFGAWEFDFGFGEQIAFDYIFPYSPWLRIPHQALACSRGQCGGPDPPSRLALQLRPAGTDRNR